MQRHHQGGEHLQSSLISLSLIGSSINASVGFSGNQGRSALRPSARGSTSDYGHIGEVQGLV